MASPTVTFSEIQSVYDRASSSNRAKLGFVMSMAQHTFDEFLAGRLDERRASAELESHLENMRRRAGRSSPEVGVLEEALASLRKRINAHPATLAHLEAKAANRKPTAAEKRAYDNLEDIWENAAASVANFAKGGGTSSSSFAQARADVAHAMEEVGSTTAPKKPSPKKTDVDPSLWTTERRFGAAGGPDVVVLTDEGRERAFSIGAQVTPEKGLALADLSAAGGKVLVTRLQGPRVQLTPFGKKHLAPTLAALAADGLIRRLYFDPHDPSSEGEGYELTQLGRERIDHGHAAQNDLLARVKRQVGERPSPKKPSPKKPSPKKPSPKKPSPKKPSPKKPSPKKASARRGWPGKLHDPLPMMMVVQFDGKAAYDHYEDLQGPFEVSSSGFPGQTELYDITYSVGPVSANVAEELTRRLEADKVPFDVVDLSDRYTYITTEMPEAYDGFGTTWIGTTGDKDELRVVAVRSEHLDWQTQRYGLFDKYEPGNIAAKQPSRKKVSVKQASAKRPSGKHIYTAWTVLRNKSHSYVDALPGQGGKDWGYTGDPAKAKLLTENQARQFVNQCRHTGASCGTSPAIPDSAEKRASPKKPSPKRASPKKPSPKRASPKKPSPGGPVAPYHGARGETIEEFDNNRVLWRIPRAGSTGAAWVIADYTGKMEGTGFKGKADAMVEWDKLTKVPKKASSKRVSPKQPSPKRVSSKKASPKRPSRPAGQSPYRFGVAPKVAKLHLQGVGDYDAIPAAYIEPGDITVWNYGATERVLEIKEAGKTYLKAKVVTESAAKGERTLERKLKKDRLVAVTRPAVERVRDLEENVAKRMTAQKRQSTQAVVANRPLARHLIDQFNNALAPLYEGYFFRVYEDRGPGGVGVAVEAAQAPANATKQEAIKSPLIVGLYMTGYPQAARKWLVGEPAPAEVQAFARSARTGDVLPPLSNLFGHHEGWPREMASKIINFFRRHADQIKSAPPAIKMGQDMKFMEGFALKHPSVQRCLGWREIRRRVEDLISGEQFIDALVPRLARLAHRNQDMAPDTIRDAFWQAANETDWSIDPDQAYDAVVDGGLLLSTGMGDAELLRFMCSDVDPEMPPTGGDLLENTQWALEASGADPRLASDLIDRLTSLANSEQATKGRIEYSDFQETIDDWLSLAGREHWTPDYQLLEGALRKALVVFYVPDFKAWGPHSLPDGVYFPPARYARTPQGALEFFADERQAWESGARAKALGYNLEDDTDRGEYKYDADREMKILDAAEYEFKRIAGTEKPWSSLARKRVSPKKPSPKPVSSKKASAKKLAARPQKPFDPRPGMVLEGGWVIRKVSSNAKRVTIYLPSSRDGGYKMGRDLTFNWDDDMGTWKRQGKGIPLPSGVTKPSPKKPSPKKPSPKKPSPKKPSPKKPSEKHLKITDPGAFGKLAKIEGEIWERKQMAGGVKLDNSFALNLAAYKVIVDQGLAGLDIPLSELDDKAGVIAGFAGAIYIVMPDGEIMLDGASTTKSKRANAARLMQVIEED